MSDHRHLNSQADRRYIDGRDNTFCEVCNKITLCGPDPCMGHIPGVSHACCGHGETRRAFVCFGGEPGEDIRYTTTMTIRGQDALTFISFMNHAEFQTPTLFRKEGE